MCIPNLVHCSVIAVILSFGASLGQCQDPGTVRLVTSGKISFIWCPPGMFEAGSSIEEEGRDPDETQGTIVLSRGFWISQSEITEAQWDAIDLTEIEESSRKLMATIEGSHQPKTMISGNEATEFCDRLTRFAYAEAELLRKRNRLTESLVFKNDEAFRLPTEAEWEFACRAGTTTAFSCGDDLTTIANGIWFLDAIPGTELTHAQFVKQKSPNPWGLFDMHGNVWEWCSDSYERERTLGTDPMVRTASSMQVLRGGSWRYPVNRARSANRDGRAPDYKSDDIGFRIVLGPMVHPIDE